MVTGRQRSTLAAFSFCVMTKQVFQTKRNSSWKRREESIQRKLCLRVPEQQDLQKLDTYPPCIINKTVHTLIFRILAKNERQ
jgi:hypothetical protein